MPHQIVLDTNRVISRFKTSRIRFNDLIDSVPVLTPILIGSPGQTEYPSDEFAAGIKLLFVWDDYLFIGIGDSVGSGGSAAPNVYDFDGTTINAGTQLDDHALYSAVYAAYKMWLLGQDDDDDTTGNIYPYAGNKTWTLTSPATLINKLHVLGGIEFNGDMWLCFGASTNGPIVGKSTDRGLTFTIYNVPEEAITIRPLRGWTFINHEGSLYLSTSGSVFAAAPNGYTTDLPYLMVYKYDNVEDEWVSSGFNFAPDDPLEAIWDDNISNYRFGGIFKAGTFAGETIYLTGQNRTDFEFPILNSFYRLTGTTPVKMTFMGNYSIRDFLVFNGAVYAIGDFEGTARLWVSTNLNSWTVLGQWTLDTDVYPRQLAAYKGVLYYGDGTTYGGSGEGGNLYALESELISEYTENYDYAIGIATQPASQNVANGGTASLSVVASGDGPFTYQWYAGTSGDTSNPINGAITENYTTGVLTAGASYWVRVIGKGGHVDSNTAILIVAPAITSGTPPTADAVVGQSYTQAAPTVTGSTPTFTLAVKDPTGAAIVGHGLNINSSTGEITGTVGAVTTTYSGIWTIERTATNAAGSDMETWTVRAYLFIDKFTTADAAPLGSPRATEPAGGSWTVIEMNGEFSISSGAFNFPAQTTPVLGNQSMYAGPFARTNGRALMFDMSMSTRSTCYPMVWNSTASGAPSLSNGMYTTSTAFRLRTGSSAAGFDIAALAASTTYSIAIVQRDNGCYIYIKSGSDWVLQWVDTWGSFLNTYVLFANHSAVGTLDNVRVIDLPAPYATEFGLAIVNVTSDFGTIQTGTATGTHVLRFERGTTTANDTVTLNFRQTDANNLLRVVVSRNAGNTAYDIELQSVVAGTPADLATKVTGISSVDVIEVRTNGTTIEVYTLAGSLWTRRFNVTNSIQQSATGISAATNGSTFTLTRMTAFERIAGASNTILNAA